MVHHLSSGQQRQALSFVRKVQAVRRWSEVWSVQLPTLFWIRYLSADLEWGRQGLRLRQQSAIFWQAFIISGISWKRVKAFPSVRSISNAESRFYQGYVRLVFRPQFFQHWWVYQRSCWIRFWSSTEMHRWRRLELYSRQICLLPSFKWDLPTACSRWWVTILGQAIRNVLWKWTVLRKNAVWLLESWRRHYFSFFENQLSTCSLTIKTLYIMAWKCWLHIWFPDRLSESFL